MLKRYIALFMVLVLCMVPFSSAFAAEGEDVSEPTPEVVAVHDGDANEYEVATGDTRVEYVVETDENGVTRASTILYKRIVFFVNDPTRFQGPSMIYWTNYEDDLGKVFKGYIYRNQKIGYASDKGSVVIEYKATVVTTTATPDGTVTIELPEDVQMEIEKVSEQIDPQVATWNAYVYVHYVGIYPNSFVAPKTLTWTDYFNWTKYSGTVTHRVNDDINIATNSDGTVDRRCYYYGTLTEVS